MSGVRFTRESAKRIADVVRTVELGDRDAQGLRFGSLVDAQRKVFRIATFTGAWAINSTKTVTFKYQTSTPNTASVLNLFFPYPDATSATDCAIARDGTAWHLIDVPFETATAAFVGATATGVAVLASGTQTLVSDIQIAATLNTFSCAITVSKTQTTASVSIIQSTATAAFVSSAYTSTFIRFKV